FADVADVDVVRLAVAEAVEGKFRKLDRDRARQRAVGKDALVIVVEIAVAHGQVVALLANSHAVLVNYVCAAELDVLYRRVGSRYDQDALALRILPAGVNMRAPAAHAADGQAVGGPGADIADIGDAGVDFDDVARDRGRNGCARRRKRLTRSHLANGC